jgi:hypothetical protein
MQSPIPSRSIHQQPQASTPRQTLTPRADRSVDDTVRPGAIVLEPHWAAAIDAATD